MFLADNHRSRFLTPDLSTWGTSSSEDRRLRARDHAARGVRAAARDVRVCTRGHGAGLPARAPPRVCGTRREGGSAVPAPGEPVAGEWRRKCGQHAEARPGMRTEVQGERARTGAPDGAAAETHHNRATTPASCRHYA